MYCGSEAVQTNKLLNKTYSLNSINLKKGMTPMVSMKKRELTVSTHIDGKKSYFHLHQCSQLYCI